MKTMQATDLRRNVYGILDDVEASREPVVVKKHGRPVAVLVPSPNLPGSRRKPTIDLNAIAAFCSKHAVKSFALFGSILRDDFDEQSDVDVLVDTGDRHLNFHEECAMLDDLELIFGRKIDLVPRCELPAMKEHRRASITSSAQVIYATS